MEPKNKIEAVLFATGRFLSINEIASMCGINPGIIKELIEKLLKICA